MYGAGAGGGHFAVKLARAGHEVSIVARGPQLDAIRQNGLQLRSGAEILEARVRASEYPSELGVQDLVIVSVKATALGDVAEKLAPLVREETPVVFPQNGIPWWYPVGLSVECPSLPFFSLGQKFLKVIRPEQIIGGIIYSANEIEAPGVVRNNSPGYNRLDVGAINDEDTSAVSEIHSALRNSGLLSEVVESIRTAVWVKLLANMSGSAIALVTQRKSAACRDDIAMSEIFRKLVREGAAIAAASGFPFRVDPDAMLSRLADHKPSILQDYEQNKPMEIAEILLAPVAFARALSVPTPTLDVIAALATNMAVERGLYKSL